MNIDKIMKIEVNHQRIKEYLNESKNKPINEILKSDEIKELNSYLNSQKIFEGNINQYERYIKTPTGNKCILQEQQGISRILDRIEKFCFQGVTQFRGSFTYHVNTIRNKELTNFLNEIIAPMGYSKSDFGYYKTMGRWAECDDETIPYTQCPDNMKKSTFEESFVFIRSNEKVKIWDFIYQMVQLGKLGEQDSVVLGLTFEEQKEIINTNYNVPFSKSIFQKYVQEQEAHLSILKNIEQKETDEKTKNKELADKDNPNNYHGMFSGMRVQEKYELDHDRINNLIDHFPSPDELKSFVESMFDENNTRNLYFFYFPRNTENEFSTLGRNITLSEIEQAFSMLRGSDKSKNLGNPNYKKDKREWYNSKSIKGKIDNDQVTEVPFQVTECKYFELLGFEVPSAKTSLSKLQFKHEGILYK